MSPRSRKLSRKTAPVRTILRKKMAAARPSRGLLCALAVAFFVAAVAAGPVCALAQGAPAHFNMAVLYGTHIPGLGKPARQWALLTQALSGKTLRISILQPGQSVPPQELLDAVSQGKVDAGFATAGFWANRFPAASLFSGYPFGPDAATYAAWYQAGDGLKLYQQMYDEAGLNVHVLPCAFAGGETAGWYAKPLQTMQDLDGLRVRFFGQGGLVMDRLGAVSVIVPGSQLAEAFEDGEIDAAELYPPAVDAQASLAGVAKYIYLPGWHQPETVMELLINKDRWNALDQRQQQWIETACQATQLRTMAKNRVTAAEAMAGFASQGVEIKTWPASLLAAFQQSWEEIAAQEAKNDPFFASVLDDIRAFRAKSHPLDAPPPAPLTASTEPADEAATGSTGEAAR